MLHFSEYIKERLTIETKSLSDLTIPNINHLRTARLAYMPSEPAINQAWFAVYHIKTALNLLDIATDDLQSVDFEKDINLLGVLIEHLDEKRIESLLLKSGSLSTHLLTSNRQVIEGPVLELLLWSVLPSISFHKTLVYQILRSSGLSYSKHHVVTRPKT
jgi:hypothetical protein